MAVAANKLLVLKAFYMGHAISTRTQSVSIALGMIDAAIRHFEHRQGTRDQLRLLFYVLLKAEILRGTEGVLPLRSWAQRLSGEVGGGIFDHFMSVENATQSKKRAYGMHVGVIADEGVKERFDYTSGPWIFSYDAACRALNVDEHRLTDKEHHFLRNVTLKEMLDKHGVDYDP